MDQPAEGGDLPEAGPGAEHAVTASDVGADDDFDAGPDLSDLDDEVDDELDDVDLDDVDAVDGGN
jgi:hypothetical protein